MGHAEALVTCDRGLLLVFSRQTSRALQQRFAAGMALPWLDQFLDLNVAKEILKDRQVILAARHPGPAEMAALLAAARAVDRDFLHQVARLPIEIPIPYDAIEPIRARRMELLLALARSLLAAWKPGMKLSKVLLAALPERELEASLRQLMWLYAEETRAICLALRLPLLLRPLRDRLAEALFEVMTGTAADLARQAVHLIGRHRPGQWPIQP